MPSDVKCASCGETSARASLLSVYDKDGHHPICCVASDFGPLSVRADEGPVPPGFFRLWVGGGLRFNAPREARR